MNKNVEIIGLRDLKPDPQNARKHTPRNVAMVVDALQEVGAARSIVIDEKGVVLAGNATIKAAGQVGLARVKVVDAGGSEIIAGRRTNGDAGHTEPQGLNEVMVGSFENAEWRSLAQFKQNPSIASFQHGVLEPRLTWMFPEASLRTWMPAIHAGMTKLCIFMFCGRA